LKKNDQLKGLAFLEPIYNAIIQHTPLQVKYCSFKAREASVFPFHPWWLKEFKNRWFCVGVKTKGGQLLNLALDRIESLSLLEHETYFGNTGITTEAYYKNVIGVTVCQTCAIIRSEFLLIGRLHLMWKQSLCMLHNKQQIESIAALL